MKWLLAPSVAAALCVAACHDDYRIGEFVWVDWDGRDYPAYVIDRKHNAKYRVHYDGYDTRWDEDVTVDRVKGRIKGPATVPPPPERVARAMGISPTPSASAATVSSTFAVGDRVRVRWRESVYTATVMALEGRSKIRVHYEGYGPEWDEVVSEERIIGKR
ncbi:MAG TPA: Tudor-knot domain-containing protein [Polyangiaceae bacterium]|jgi:hypothetical protein|nr:Tudor-knot domain-containing protein [Polyangiaceae bacterium]